MNKLGYFLLLLPLLFAFGKNKKPQTSKYLTKHYVKVPAGKVYMHPDRMRAEKLDSFKMLDARAAAVLPQRFFNDGLDSTSEFFISSTEVTNIQWKEFLMYLKQEGRMEEYNANVLNTTVWRQRLAYNEPFVNYYYQHQTYSEYPAVGMTLKQAIAYADWLTEIFAMRDQGVKVTFSVPTKKQWIRAARGGASTQYPWDGPYLRNSKGSFLSNHKAVGSENIHLERSTNNLVVVSSGNKGVENTITAPGESYYPNQFGIYNMSGNVAELVSDDTVAMGGSWNDTGYDVRVESEQPASEPKSTIGFRVVAVIE
ncbi:formylglycine-generating enzyme family protein [Bacteroidia bacterium]|jgi:formylglycine-generating enzyme required for sulfatase activity|nr:formylglycine-generating enzyme family protein [Bacteroidia bacterium]|tara:strand:+ start:840 stop:1775 length:936 start_codon:yes stop_codon:yes gene_type:complete